MVWHDECDQLAFHSTMFQLVLNEIDVNLTDALKAVQMAIAMGSNAILAITCFPSLSLLLSLSLSILCYDLSPL